MLFPFNLIEAFAILFPFISVAVYYFFRIKPNRLLLLQALIVVLLLTFRKGEGDTASYINHFYHYQQFSLEQALGWLRDPGHFLIIKLSYQFSSSHYFYFFFYAFMSVAPFVLLFLRFSSLPFLSFWFFLCDGGFLSMAQSMRSALAVGICTLIIYFFLEHKRAVALLFASFAPFIHMSSLVFFVVPISKFLRTPVFAFTSLAVSAIVGLSSLPSALIQSASSAAFFSDSSGDSRLDVITSRAPQILTSGLSLLILILILVVLYTRSPACQYNSIERVLISISVVGFSIELIFLKFGFLPARLSQFFVFPSFPILVVNSIRFLKPSSRISAYLALVLYSSFKLFLVGSMASPFYVDIPS